MVDISLLQSLSYVAAAIGVCVAAFYYVMMIRISQRNQEASLKTQELMLKAQQQTLENRQAQMFLNIYDKTMSKDFGNAWTKIMRTPWKTYEEWNMHYMNDPEFQMAENITQFFFEGLGTLIKEGLLPIRMVALLMCGMTRYHWEKHASMVEDGRRVTGHRRWFSEEEYLYNELMRYLGEHPELDTRIERPTWVDEAK